MLRTGLRQVASLPLLAMRGVRHVPGYNPSSTQWIRHEELVRRLPEDPRPLRVLDIGCGAGYLIMKAKAARSHWHFEGCDWLDNIPHGGDFPYNKVDLNRTFLTGYGDSSFDALLCSDVLEHLENPARMFQDMARVSKPGAAALLSLPNAWNIFERLRFLCTGRLKRYRSERQSGPYGHISLFTADTLESLADRSGWQVTSITGGHTLFSGVLLPWTKSTLVSYNLFITLTRTVDRTGV